MMAIMLIVSIVVGVLILQVLRKVKAMSDSAQAAVHNVEEFTEQLKGMGKISAVGSIAKEVITLIKKRKG